MAIGFAIAAPVGPVGVLCIRRALADGRYAAFVAGLGAACADTLYGAVVGLGLSFISHFLTDHATALKLVGGLFLLVLGVRTWRTHTCIEPSPNRGPGLVKDFISTFLITLTNPGTILAFMGTFAALGSVGQGKAVQSGWLILGVFTGSALWWLTLSAAAGAVRSRFTPQALEWLNKLSGGALVVFGLAVLGMLAFEPAGGWDMQALMHAMTL